MDFKNILISCSPCIILTILEIIFIIIGYSFYSKSQSDIENSNSDIKSSDRNKNLNIAATFITLFCLCLPCFILTFFSAASVILDPYSF